MKTKRHTKIVEIISANNIETQEELAEKLRESGFHVTQATVSRDIRDLKLSKVILPSGKQKYSLVSESVGISERFIRIFREGYITMTMAENIIVIKTVSGMAMAVAAALDSMQLNEIVGCIAGDDTIMAVVSSKGKTERAMEKLRRLIYVKGEGELETEEPKEEMEKPENEGTEIIEESKTVDEPETKDEKSSRIRQKKTEE